MFSPLHKDKVIFAACFFLSCAAFNLCYSQVSFPFTGRVNAEDVNLRVDSTVGSSAICKLGKGDKVEVVSGLYDWYKIRLPINAPSYVRKDLVNASEAQVQMKPGSLEKACYSAVVSKERINVRLMPTESSAVLGKLDKGETVKVVGGADNDWLRIEPIAKSYGWVHKKFVDVVTVEPDEIKAAVKVKAKDKRPQ